MPTGTEWMRPSSPSVDRVARWYSRRKASASSVITLPAWHGRVAPRASAPLVAARVRRRAAARQLQQDQDVPRQRNIGGLQADVLTDHPTHTGRGACVAREGQSAETWWFPDSTQNKQTT